MTFKKGFDPDRKKFTIEERKAGALAYKKKREIIFYNTDFELLGRKLKFKRVKVEQNWCCLVCGINKWLESRIVLEIDHIDGNKLNNSRDNLRALCPNCHSQTPTWRKRKTALVDKLVKSPVLETGNFASSNLA